MTNLVNFTKAAFSFRGGSFNLNNGTENPKKGYMVATIGNELKVHINPRLKVEHQINELTKKIFNYIGDKFDVWYNSENAYLGLWYNSENSLWYIDISENIADLTEAIMLGKYRNQLAIWDCENDNEIKL